MKLLFRNFRVLTLLLGIGLLAYLIFSSAGTTQAQISATGLLKVNGSDGPISVSLNESVIVSWSGLPTSTSYTCGLSNYAGYTYSIPLAQRPSGQTTYTVNQAQLLELGCSSTTSAPVVDNVVINISGSSTPAPTPATSTADLWAEYGTTKVGDRAGGNATTFSISSGQSITLKWACPASNTGVKLNDMAIAIGGTASGSRPAQTVTQNTTWHLQCYTSATAYLDDWLTANVTATPAPTPVPTLSGTLTIRGFNDQIKRKEVTLSQNDFPAVLEWSTTINTQCKIIGYSLIFNRELYSQDLPLTNIGSLSIDMIVAQGHNIRYQLICNDSGIEKILDSAILKLKTGQVNIEVYEVNMVNNIPNKIPAAGATICASVRSSADIQCFNNQVTDSNGKATIILPEGDYDVFVNKMGMYSDENSVDLPEDNGKIIVLQLINKAQAASRISGHVRSRSDNRPLTGIPVFLLDSSNRTFAVGENISISDHSIIGFSTTMGSDILNGGLFVFDFSNSIETIKKILNREVQVAIITSEENSGGIKIKTISNRLKLTQSYGQNLKTNLVIDIDESINSFSLTTTVSGQDYRGGIEDSVRNATVTIKIGSHVLASGGTDRAITFSRFWNNLDLTGYALDVIVQSLDYKDRQVKIVFNRDNPYKTIAIVLETNLANTCDDIDVDVSEVSLIFCGIEAKDMAADPQYRNIWIDLAKTLQGLKNYSQNNIPTVFIHTSDTDNAFFYADQNLQNPCPQGAQIGIYTYLIKLAKINNNPNLIYHTVTHEFGHFKDYYNGGKCDTASNQWYYRFTLGRIEANSNHHLAFYELIDEDRYDNSLTGSTHSNEYPAETYAATFHLKSLHEATYQQKLDEFNGKFPGFKNVVESFNYFVMTPLPI